LFSRWESGLKKSFKALNGGFIPRSWSLMKLGTTAGQNGL
jgi:hypothetical protein